MTFADDILDDFTIFDGLETVTLTPQNAAGTPVTGVQALRRALNTRTISMFSDVAIEPTDVPIILFVGNADNVSLAGTVPKGGDKLTDAADVNWTIKSVAQQTMQSRHTCLCKKQVSNSD